MEADGTFWAMGTTAMVAQVGGAAGLRRRAIERIEDLESRWSRFRPDSELSRLNTAATGRPTMVSRETFRLIEQAVLGWQATDGWYDPTVLDAVILNGYDRSYSTIPQDRSAAESLARPAPGCTGIELDRARCAVTLPVGVSIDPGGIGKGLAADIVAEELVANGAAGALVDIGGDIRVIGDGPEDGAWVVDVEDPFDADHPLLHLLLSDAGIATSSRLRRNWRVNGVSRHHLISPSTGRPIDTPIVAATVIADTACRAETMTKAVFGTGDPGRLDEVSAIVIDELGHRRGTADLMRWAA